MNVHIFLQCYNESVLLPHAVNHYKKFLPSCKITIHDNESTDNSVEVAKSLGCSVISWNSNNILDEFKLTEIRNNCWKSVENGWIIVADMDEFLCVTEDNLLEEFIKGTTILRVRGLDMIGESQLPDLADIDLQLLKKYKYHGPENKNICFLREKIIEMNYSYGAHECYPSGDIVFSSNEYTLKHMSSLGLKFIINKYINRFNRTHQMRSRGLSTHYTDNIDSITEMYMNQLTTCNIME